jgi:cyclopropane-fatty-acyl-phospholipid synthase
MTTLKLEHGPWAYWADFAVYLGAAAGLAALLGWQGPPGRGLHLLGFMVLGLVFWTLAEYALHRWVLHGVAPFSRWHAEHHRRPMALIATPTVLTLPAFVVVVFLPVWWLGDFWQACAFSLGVLAGFQIYAFSHHAVHHWRADSAWLKALKRWHAIHHRALHAHRSGLAPVLSCYGVSVPLWDHLLGSAPRPREKTSG